MSLSVGNSASTRSTNIPSVQPVVIPTVPAAVGAPAEGGYQGVREGADDTRGIAPEAAFFGPQLAALLQLLTAKPPLRLEDLATEVDLSTTEPDDLVAPPVTKENFARLDSRIRQKGHLADAMSFAHDGGNRPGVSALITGEAGTGKHTAARALARGLGKPLFEVNLSAILGTPAEIAANLAAVIKLAQAKDGILLIPSLESLLATKNPGVPEISAALAQSLHHQSAVVLLLAEHGTSTLASVLTQSIDETIQIGYPDIKERTQLWIRAFPPAISLEDGFEELAHGLASAAPINGGAIVRSAKRAAAMAHEEGVPVGKKHLKAALVLELAARGQSPLDLLRNL